MNAKKIYLGLLFSSAVAGAIALPGCETTPPTQEQKDTLKDDSSTALNNMTREDPYLDTFMKGAAGVAIFPSVGKAGAGLGGGWGRGRVYQDGKFIGYADITMGTVGAQLGGSTYSELIVFQDKDSLDRLKNNKFEVEASASAIVLRAGASADAKYNKGIAIFTRPVGGLMADASVGGQQFTFTPASE